MLGNGMPVDSARSRAVSVWRCGEKASSTASTRRAPSAPADGGTAAPADWGTAAPDGWGTAASDGWGGTDGWAGPAGPFGPGGPGGCGAVTAESVANEGRFLTKS